MNEITFQTTVDLGIWNVQKGREISRHSLKLAEEVELTIYKVDSSSGAIDPHSTLAPQGTAQDIYASLFVTKPASDTTALWPLLFPHRTHTLKDFVLELFVPINRRNFVDRNESPLIQTIARISIFIVEIFTLIIRLFTCIPALLWQRAQAPHPAKTYFPQAEAVFVECKKTWTVKDETKDLSTGSTVFHWRVDFYPALEDTFEWNGRTYPIDNNRNQRVVLEGLDGNDCAPRLNFCNQDIDETFYYREFQGESRLYLYQSLESYCKPLEIATF